MFSLFVKTVRGPVPRARSGRYRTATVLVCLAAFGVPLAASEPTEAVSSEKQDRVEATTSDVGGRAIVVAAEGIARSQVVAIGRDLIVEGTVYGNAAVLTGNATVSGRIGGDLVVLEGSATLLGNAHIEGDVVVLGGEIDLQDRARVDGRSLAYPKASQALLALIEVPSLGGRPVLFTAKLGVLLAWWLAGSLLVSMFSRGLFRTSDQVVDQPMVSFFLGLTFLLAGAFGFVLLSAFVPSLLSLPLVVLFVMVAAVLKVWGTVAVLAALGRAIRERTSKGPADGLGQFLLGLCLLGAIKLIPWFGTVVWSSVTLVGMGAAFRAARETTGSS